MSLTERSTQDLIQAIHSPSDDEYALNRARATLHLHYDRDMSDMDRKEMLDEFGRALRGFPRWAVAQAFDEWNSKEDRRPKPSNLAKLAEAAVGRIAAEIKRRQRNDAAALPPPREDRVSPEAAREILERAGFTARRMGIPKMPKPELPASDEDRRAHMRAVMDGLKDIPIVRVDDVAATERVEQRIGEARG